MKVLVLLDPDCQSGSGSTTLHVSLIILFETTEKVQTWPLKIPIVVTGKLDSGHSVAATVGWRVFSTFIRDTRHPMVVLLQQLFGSINHSVNGFTLPKMEFLNGISESSHT
jgi:hypothetical protein